MPPVVCKFWQQGSCRFGDRCRFEHPPLDRNTPDGNRFSALQNLDNSNARHNNGSQSGASTGRTLPFSLDKGSIITDLSAERPQWILSAYGPGRNAPAQLFGGSIREQSFEEMRLLHCIGLRSGNAQQVVQEAEKLFQASEQQIQAALNNIDGAINFIINAEKDHPNRIDIIQSFASRAGSNLNPFAQVGSDSNRFQASPAASNPFGNTPSQTVSTSAGEGPTMVPPVGAFGQPWAPGQKPNTFSAPSQRFGQQSNHGAAGGFGRPSTLGTKPNPFGAPSGASAPFSSFTGTANPFAQQPQSVTSNAFGTPSQPAASIHLGSSPQQAQPNPFGQPSGQNPGLFSLSNKPPQPNPFGNTSSTVFGAPSPAPKNPFGAPSGQTQVANIPGGSSAVPPRNPFGPGSTASVFPNSPGTLNPFGNHPEGPNSAVANPFGNPSLPGPSIAATNPLGVTSQPPKLGLNGDAEQTTFGPGTSLEHPPLNAYSSVGPGGRLTTFKGKRVVYRNDEAGFQNTDGTWAKIWFPEGPPGYYKDTEMDNSKYNDRTEAAYMCARQTGSFQGAVMPMVPPKREWCLWDF